MAAYKLVVTSNAVEGREDEYNDWYDNQHVPDVLNVPGFHGAQRLVIENPLSDAPPPFKYMAIYEFETDDLKKTFAYFLSVTNTDKMPISAAMDRNASMQICRADGAAIVREAPTPWPAG